MVERGVERGDWALDDDLFAIVGTSPEAAPAEVKRAFHRQARLLHPDCNPGPDSAQQFRRLVAAFNTLSDPRKRGRWLKMRAIKSQRARAYRATSPFSEQYGGSVRTRTQTADFYSSRPSPPASVRTRAQPPHEVRTGTSAPDFFSTRQTQGTAFRSSPHHAASVRAKAATEGFEASSWQGAAYVRTTADDAEFTPRRSQQGAHFARYVRTRAPPTPPVGYSARVPDVVSTEQAHGGATRSRASARPKAKRTRPPHEVETDETQTTSQSRPPRTQTLRDNPTTSNPQFSDSVSSKASSPGSSIAVPCGSLRTWSYSSPSVEQMQITLSDEGSSLNADVELWHGPHDSPCKVHVYHEKGEACPFSAVIKTPLGPNTVAVRNKGNVESLLVAGVLASSVDTPSAECLSSGTDVERGSVRLHKLDPSINSVQVLLTNEGSPLHARIELLRGGEHQKQVIELYTEDGFKRPFFCIIETPGKDNAVCITNTCPDSSTSRAADRSVVAAVVPHSIDEEISPAGSAIRTESVTRLQRREAELKAEVSAIAALVTEESKALKAKEASETHPDAGDEPLLLELQEAAAAVDAIREEMVTRLHAAKEARETMRADVTQGHGDGSREKAAQRRRDAALGSEANEARDELEPLAHAEVEEDEMTSFRVDEVAATLRNAKLEAARQEAELLREELRKTTAAADALWAQMEVRMREAAAARQAARAADAQKIERLKVREARLKVEVDAVSAQVKAEADALAGKAAADADAARALRVELEEAAAAADAMKTNMEMKLQAAEHAREIARAEAAQAESVSDAAQMLADAARSDEPSDTVEGQGEDAHSQTQGTEVDEGTWAWNRMAFWKSIDDILRNCS
ncbi:MAG: hypothetical protein SGPRY_004958 [Prymnesium sp.]